MPSSQTSYTRLRTVDSGSKILPELPTDPALRVRAVCTRCGERGEYDPGGGLCRVCLAGQRQEPWATKYAATPPEDFQPEVEFLEEPEAKKIRKLHQLNKKIQLGKV